MPVTQGFVASLAVVLSAGALAAVVCRWLGQPVVLGYIVAGILIGPHTPPTVLADMNVVRGLADLGVILVMFSLGLEFSFGRLARMLPRAGLATLFELSLIAWLGFVVGQWLGFTPMASVLAGVIVAISSDTVVARAFADAHVGERFKEVVWGVLLVEDLVAVALLAIFATLPTHTSFDLLTVGSTLGRMAVTLIVLLAAGMFVIPRFVRAVARLHNDETLLIAAVGLCFAFALAAEAVGYSLALGAFAAGTLVAESGEGLRVEKLVDAVRDVFAAIFFVSVGTLLDPALALEDWDAVAAFSVLVVGGNFVGVTLGAFLSGNGVRASVRAGMSLGQIGEFSYIIAAVAAARGAIPQSLYSVTVAVGVITTFLTPWMIRWSPAAAAAIDHRLPNPLQTFAAFYDTWLDRLRTSARYETRWTRLWWRLRWALVDAVALGVITIGASVESRTIVPWLDSRFGVGREVAGTLMVAGALALGAPFALGMVNVARRLGVQLASRALPRVEGQELDLADAPRRVLVVVMQLAIVLLFGVPLLAVTQPFLPAFGGALVLALVLGVLGVIFWRSAAGFEGHVRAGAQMIVEVLANQSRAHQRASLDAVERVLPGFGKLVPVRIEQTSAAVGKTLAELDIRATTGATVLAILRGDEEVVIPIARETLREGDLLALAGSDEAISEAHALLTEVRAEAPERNADRGAS
jgi:CPA2 family monovalent cation:H+ antiporter-2